MTRRLLVASATALVAGATAALALDAATRSPRTAICVALAAVWLSQAIGPLLRRIIPTRTAARGAS
ncbi:hypothetical protein [Micromonospora sp. RTGN7]|uniref:hypothetical protein n=1 Tax=Micromonospora sp. RTGN7 TaxID=3016526 RepID=UPI0029FEE860|nr:hypothetical protein [Micromonospora sp. RTGN7]